MYKLEIDSNLQCYEIKISKEYNVFLHKETMVRNQRASVQFRTSDFKYHDDILHVLLLCGSIYQFKKLKIKKRSAFLLVCTPFK